VFKQIHHLPAKYEIYSKQPPLCYSSDPEKEKKAQRREKIGYVTLKKA
jgi:hypothetical protein